MSSEASLTEVAFREPIIVPDGTSPVLAAIAQVPHKELFDSAHRYILERVPSLDDPSVDGVQREEIIFGKSILIGRLPTLLVVDVWQ